MHFYRCQKGFTLLELVTTLILVGSSALSQAFFFIRESAVFLTSKFSSERLSRLKSLSTASALS